jgi:uncharacterized protein (TIGR02147 family)
MQSLLTYDHYKSYRTDRLDSDPRGRGMRSALARATRCQTAYVSAVLRGNAHFTPEQAEAINEFLSHTETESDFFLLLLQFNRAGTDALRKRLKRQLEKIKESRFDLKKRLSVQQSLNLEDQSVYYSQWYFAAIHALASIPGFQNISALASRLRLDASVVSESVQFLLGAGLLEQNRHGLKVGKKQLHLGAESPLIAKHHMNWRLQAMQSLSRKQSNNLHYSSVTTLSEKDAERIKDMVISLIREAKAIIRDSKEETLQAFTVDFFQA